MMKKQGKRGRFSVQPDRAKLLIVAGMGLVLGAVGPAVAKQPVEAQPPQKAGKASPVRLPIAQLVRDLDSDSYADRQRATQALLRRGKEAIPALQRAAETGSLEAAARAVLILERLYTDLTLDDETAERVGAALEALRVSRTSPATQLARDVLSRHGDIREKRALAAIERLGGIIEYLPAGYRAPNRPNVTPGTQRVVNFIVLGSRWRGGDEGLKYIRRVTTLQNLYVARNKAFSPVSQKALDRLIADMPNLRVHERGLACLGVSGTQTLGGNAIGCYVSRVKRSSAAALAGVRPGDYIVSFAGKKVRDFESLVEFIAEHKPGEKVEVGLRRGGSVLTVHVVLQEWKKLDD